MRMGGRGCGRQRWVTSALCWPRRARIASHHPYLVQGCVRVYGKGGEGRTGSGRGGEGLFVHSFGGSERTLGRVECLP